MTDLQWQDLLRILRGERLETLPVGLIIDCPWLPGWAGISVLDYFHDPEAWRQANLRAVRAFPQIMFLPGFWAEYGMCTEPSAFGAKCAWYENAFPNAERVLFDYAEVDRLRKPDCRTDGMAAFVLKRLTGSRVAIEKAGHRIRFAVARGPLNIASYLLGHTEFLMGVKTNPDEVHRLLAIVTEYLVDWIGLQADTINTIDGIFLLDDLIGFLGDEDFQEFALPYLKQIFDSRRVSVKFLHNDAAGLITARHLAAMGVNLFNFSFNHSLAEMRKAAGESVVLLGNIPPRDVLAAASPEEVRRCVAVALESLADKRRVILSCGGALRPMRGPRTLKRYARPPERVR